MKFINKQLLSCLLILNSFLYISNSLAEDQSKSLESTTRSKSNHSKKQFISANSMPATFNHKTPATNIIMNYNNFSNQSVMSVFILQNHKVNCETGLLQGFQLKKVGSTISYEYACSENIDISNKESYQGSTPQGYSQNSVPVDWLRRHIIKCRPGFALQSFNIHFMPPPGQQFKYLFKCVKVQLSNCRQATSFALPDGGELTIDKLFRTSVLVKKGQAIQHFKVSYDRRRNGVFYFYEFSFCDVMERPSQKLSIKNGLNNDDRRQKIQEGNKFCKTNCIPNPSSRGKKCWMKGPKSCNSCQYKDLRNINANRDTNSLCKASCNSLKNSNICAYYPYTNDKKKIINKNILSKFNLRLFRRYLKK